MRRLLMGLGLLTLIVVGGYVLRAAGQWASGSCPLTGHSNQSASGNGANEQEYATNQGQVAGNFDPVMSGVCRFACATKLKYEPRDLHPQPGATAGRLTQCPVSGVVFMVDAERPHVRVASNEYTLCCDRCAEKFRKAPSHFVNL